MYYNPYIVIPFATWLIAQTLKFAISAIRGDVNFKYFYASGGMPSVHSTVVCALATTALLVDGGDSHLFGFTLLFAAIVMYDSFGVRRSTGEQAVAINMIVQSLDRDRVKLTTPDIHLREILGHKPIEVTAGAVLGVVLGLVFNASHLTAQIDFMTALPGRIELYVYATIFAIMIVGGWIVPVVLRMRYKGSKIIARVGRNILTMTQTIGWLGAVVAFGQFEHLPYLSYRLWAILLIVVYVGWKIFLLAKFWRLVPEQLALENENKRKVKWFQRKKKRK